MKKKIEKRRLYTDEQIDEAIEVVRNRTQEVIRILGKRANLIAYMIDPYRTAVGASLSYNEDVFENAFYHNVVCRKDLAFDGNAGFTLLALAEMIKKEII